LLALGIEGRMCSKLLVAQAIWGKRGEAPLVLAMLLGCSDFGERMSKLLACLRLEGSREIDLDV
jgi:hypothetical protein